MKSKFHKILAFVMAFAVCFSCLPVSSFAVLLDGEYIYSVSESIWDFIFQNDRNYHGGGRFGFDHDFYGGGRFESDSDIAAAYDSYVSSLDSPIVSSNGEIRIQSYLTGDSAMGSTSPGSSVSVFGNAASIHWTWESPITNTFRLYYSWPRTYFGPGKLTFYHPAYADSSFSYTPHSGLSSLSVGSLTALYSYIGSSSSNTLYHGSYVRVSENAFLHSGDIRISLNVHSTGAFDTDVFLSLPYAIFVPDVVPDISETSEARAPSIIDTIISTNSPTSNIAYYIGTVDPVTNVVTNVYTTSIVDETASTVTIPGETPSVYNITYWNYDFSTRVYNCTTVDGEVITVEYGDDKITVTITDGNGGTTAWNYYYVRQSPPPTPATPGSDTEFVAPSSDDVEDDPNTTGGFFSTIWKAFKQGLADVIGGIINGLFKGIKALINGIMDLFGGIIGEFFDSVGDFFDAFSNDGVFGFFHNDLVIRGPTNALMG